MLPVHDGNGERATHLGTAIVEKGTTVAVVVDQAAAAMWTLPAGGGR